MLVLLAVVRANKRRETTSAFPWKPHAPSISKKYCLNWKGIIRTGHFRCRKLQWECNYENNSIVPKPLAPLYVIFCTFLLPQQYYPSNVWGYDGDAGKTTPVSFSSWFTTQRQRDWFANQRNACWKLLPLPVSRARSSPVPGVVAYFRPGYAAVQE